MISMFVVEVTCSTTGETATTWGCLRKISATLIRTGAPPNAARFDDPGGLTVRSAPIPTWRDLLSSRIPSASPTIIRISVTSTATAKIEIIDRIGRWTRLATIILFINLLTARRNDCRSSSSRPQSQDLNLLRRLFILFFGNSGGRGLGIQVNHLRSRRLCHHKLLIGQRHIHVQLDHGNCDAIALDGPLNRDDCRERNSRVISKILVTNKRHQPALPVINRLLMRKKIGPAEDDPARKIMTSAVFIDDQHRVRQLLHVLVGLGVLH